MKRPNLSIRQENPEPVQVQECIVLPSQYLGGGAGAAMFGERRLLVAVLEEAVESYCKTLDRTERRNRTVHHEASEWIFSGDRSWFLSFENVCDVLAIDAASLRERLRAWKRRRGLSQGKRELRGHPIRLAS